MNTKLLTSMGCLLLLAAAIAPSALGHDERPNPALGSAPYGLSTMNTNGVSGRYVGSAGPSITDEGFPENTLALGLLFCDLEVAGGWDHVYPQDEANIDSYATGTLVPDTWDDGGFGGACHTNHYGFEPYNTPGCPAADAYAVDAATADLWIAASCDVMTQTGGMPFGSGSLLCDANSDDGLVLQGPVVWGGPVPGSGCVWPLIKCLLNYSPIACLETSTYSCGADGIADGVNYGYGSAGVAYPVWSAHQGMPFFGAIDDEYVIDVDCAQTDATAAVYVLDAVNIEAGLVTLYPATTGDIWQV